MTQPHLRCLANADLVTAKRVGPRGGRWESTETCTVNPPATMRIREVSHV
jgi:hypothetical protein